VEATRCDLKVKWERKENNILLNIAFENDYHGTIKLPKGYAFENGETTTPLKLGTFKAIKK
jgi:hypothetical protein